MVELLVASLGLLVLGAVLLTVYLTEFKALAVLRVQSEVTSTLRSALEQIGRDVRRAQATSLACGGYASPPNLLLDIEGVSNCVVYRCNPAGACTSANPGQLELVIGANPPRLIARGVTTLVFQRDAGSPDGRWINVTIGLTQTAQGFQYTASVGDRFNLRDLP